MRLTVLSESDRHSDLTKYPCVPAEWAQGPTLTINDLGEGAQEIFFCGNFFPTGMPFENQFSPEKSLGIFFLDFLPPNPQIILQHSMIPHQIPNSLEECTYSSKQLAQANDIRSNGSYPQ